MDRFSAFDISTHAPLAGRDYVFVTVFQFRGISTHAPLAGRDESNEAIMEAAVYFNPRAPCGARQKAKIHGHNQKDFNPRAPCGARHQKKNRKYYRKKISTHAPLAGRDQSLSADAAKAYYFNPRAPCGARQQKCTNHYAHFCDNRQISDAFAQNAACQGILLLFDAGKSCGFWVRTAQVISAHLCFAL